MSKWAIWISWLVVLSAGCRDGMQTRDGSGALDVHESKAAMGEACGESTECESGTECLKGTCRAKPRSQTEGRSCLAASDCAEGLACFSDGRCAPEKCESFDDCALACPDGAAETRTAVDGGKVWCEKAGKNHGKIVTWHMNGRKATEGEWKDGKEDGRWRTWHSNGEKESAVEYKAGVMVGTWIFWHDNGQKKLEGHFEKGKGVGEWSYWDRNGIAQGPGEGKGEEEEKKEIVEAGVEKSANLKPGDGGTASESSIISEKTVRKSGGKEKHSATRRDPASETQA